MFIARRLWPVAAVCALVGLSSCSQTAELSSTQLGPESLSADPDHTSTTTVSTTTVSLDAASTTARQPDQPTIMRIRLDRRVSDEATEGFEPTVQAVLASDRGWTRAGFEFVFTDSDETDFDYTVVLAEGPEVDSLCLPYDTFGEFSCQIGPVVALNADRWRVAVDNWPTTLDDYRTMLINHEIGHLLGQHHPESRCPGEGQPAPVMAQQSSGVEACTANPWPLPWEIICVQEGVEPLAPPYETDIELTCGPDGPVRQTSPVVP